MKPHDCGPDCKGEAHDAADPVTSPTKTDPRDEMTMPCDLLREGGPWLGAARRWLKRRGGNGERVIWGSDEEVLPHMTVRDVEEVASEAVHADRRDRRAARAPATETGPDPLYDCGCDEHGICPRHRIEGHCCGEAGTYCDSDEHRAVACETCGSAAWVAYPDPDTSALTLTCARCSASPSTPAPRDPDLLDAWCACGDQLRRSDVRCGNCYAGKHRVDCDCPGCRALAASPSNDPDTDTAKETK